MDTILIVGASSGIGYECAKLFLQNDYKVLNLSRTECVLAGVTNFLCDVSDQKALTKTMDEIIESFPTIRFLLYSAGCSMASPIEYVNQGDYRYLFEVNFFGFLYCLQRLFPSLRRQSGTACVLGSVASEATIPFDSYYSASKSALNAFIKSLQTECASNNVRVIGVLPGGTKTDFSYTRKVYPEVNVGDYALEVKTCCENLKRIEQQGDSPKKVAVKVYQCITRSTFGYLFCVGVKNKILFSLSKCLPQFIFPALTKYVFFADNNNSN